MIAFWPCSNPNCDDKCPSTVLDEQGRCPSCSFNALLDAQAAKRALHRPDLWDEEEDEQEPVPAAAKLDPFPEWLSLALWAILAIALLLTLFYCLPAFQPDGGSH